MKLTTENLNKLVELYLNDVEDYGNEGEKVIAESILKPISTLLKENHNNELIPYLNEALNLTSNDIDKEIIKEFIEYIETI